MLNIEIILVNDFSTDNTSSLLEQFEKEDPRLRVIKNKKNMGILYSRSIATLSAKGKFIFPLDNDDMFLDKDVFQIISDRAEKGNFDIIEFRGVLTLPGSGDLYSRRESERLLVLMEIIMLYFNLNWVAFLIKEEVNMGNID